MLCLAPLFLSGSDQAISILWDVGGAIALPWPGMRTMPHGQVLVNKLEWRI